VSLTWRHLSIGRLLDAINREEVDLGFGSPPFPDGMDWTPLVETRFLVAIPASHRLAQKPEIQIRDLDQEPFLQVSNTQNAELHREIEQLFYDNGCTINVVYDLENSFSMIGFVAMGIGCGLVPDYACNFQQPGVTFRPLAGAALSKTVAIVQKNGRKGAVENFHRLAVGVCQ
jgi:DNA-binding transcriptional LysR family regulator